MKPVGRSETPSLDDPVHVEDDREAAAPRRSTPQRERSAARLPAKNARCGGVGGGDARQQMRLALLPAAGSGLEHH
jgi:hypothetical protein